MAITKRSSPEPYSQRYKNMAFWVWYSEGRPPMTKLQHMLEPREDGTRPTNMTLGGWKNDEGWEEEADRLDGEAAVQIQKKLINDQVRMFEEHAKIGKALRMKAVDWLEEHELTKPNEAMRLLEIASTMEKESVGLSKIIEKVRDMDDAEVKDRLARLMRENKLSRGDIQEMGKDPEQLESENG